MNTNKAKELLWPGDSTILLRFVFLYVGQGSSTIVLIRDGDSYKTLLIDINLDSENGGVNVPLLMSDLLEARELDVFVNTHPHNDHLSGIVELSDKIKIGEVWHSGHVPGTKYDDAYKNLKKVIKKVKDEGGTEEKLESSREQKTIGEAQYYLLAPKESVVEEIADEDQDTRYQRIHEQSAVLRFGREGTWVLIPGDADRNAFKNHIIEGHKERLGSVVLAASHHGSRTFFRYNEEDVAYLDGIDAIGPKYVIISAPKQGESKKDHPHEDAVNLYKDKVGDNNVFHTGAERHCYIFDILDGGACSDIKTDIGELAKSYTIDGRDGGGDGGMSFTERKEKTYIKGSRYAL